MYNINNAADNNKTMDGSYDSAIGMPSPPHAPAVTTDASDYGFPQSGAVSQWIEVWDYVGGARFRGFVAGEGDSKAMFVFFDSEATVRDLKPGLMALMELCSLDEFDCRLLNVCIDRAAPEDDTKALIKDLGWIGFEPVTLAEWTETPPIVSEKWIFLGMEV
ncbi:Ornithine decarboxylase antizyme [Macrophomina phaseolina MS6]|uniref:Ornithine decarboxylase antizyme n=2 Tax=Macrophomina phaseolina TaxID=35725 RepID=K2RSP3_MACPH|nr:Ornithine decarboxylase antizyme [Macrophomina phaseolina MS6]